MTSLAPAFTRRRAKRVAGPEGRRARCAEAVAAGGARNGTKLVWCNWKTRGAQASVPLRGRARSNRATSTLNTKV
jgi:hypothetical protein